MLRPYFFVAILFITRALPGQLPNFFDKLTIDDGLSNNTVNAIQQDRYGRMWFGTYDGLNCYDGQSIRTFRNIASDLGKSYTDNQIIMLFEDKQGTLWIVQPNSIVSRLLDYNDSRFKSYRLVPSNIFLTEIIHNENGSITLLGKNGGFEFDHYKNQFIFRKDLLDQKKEPGFLTKFKRSNPIQVQRFWNYGDSICLLATLKDGLIKLYKTPGNNYRVEKIDQQADNPYSLSNNEVYSVYTDYSGIFWIGTKDGGVNKHLPQAQYLNMLCHKPGSVNTIPRGTIRAISQDQKGNVWIGSYNDGIAIYDPEQRRYNFVNHKNKPGSDDWDRIRCIYPSSDNRMWIGCYAGIFSIDLKTGIRTYFSPGKGDGFISAGRVYSMVEDNNKYLWVGSWGGIDKIDLLTGKVSKVNTPHLVDAHVRKLMLDRKGNLWIGTEFDGVYIYDTKTGESRSFKSFGDKSSFLSNNSIYSLYQSKSGLIWIGTSDGLNVYDSENEKVVTYSVSQGLPAGLILGILEDSQGNIWLSTSKGVARVNTKTQFIRSFNKHDGWFNTEFSEGAYFKSKEGFMYFGGIEGITYFNPALIPSNKIPPQLFAEILFTDGSRTKLQINTGKDVINIPYSKKEFKIKLYAFHYTNTAKNQIAYKISGGSNDWVIKYGSNVEITKEPGNKEITLLQVKAGNADGIWSHIKTIQFRISPPFWKKGWFLSSVILTLLIGTLVFIRFRLFQERKRNAYLKSVVEERTSELELQRKQLEIKNHELEEVNRQTVSQKDQILAQHEHLLELHEKLKEVNEQKVNFFTNISHEIRTPLTLIAGPIEFLIAEGNLSTRQQDRMTQVQQQINYLLCLVNQLLDYRKLENGSMKLETEPAEFISFIEDICQLFVFEAYSQKINLSFLRPDAPLSCMFDSEKIHKIISNLLSNALKFTPEGGEIVVKVELNNEEQAVVVKVIDNGIGIPAGRINYIFDRFYQIGKSLNPHTPGTGIGLSLALELAKIHHGSLAVESEEGKGSVFTFIFPFIPVLENNLTGANVNTGKWEKEFEEAKEPQETFLSNECSVLVVDDHPGMLKFLSEVLSDNYNVLIATNAKDALRMLKHAHVDAIVTDWVMPGTDGAEFCRKVKSSKQLMSIPIIMVTALTGNHNQIRALEFGADDFITKPFSFQLLNAKLVNLLQRGKAIKESISVQEKLVPQTKKEISEDEKLLNKITYVLNENISRPDFSSEEMGELLGFSKMQLYRKVKQACGLAPNELIQSMRLKRARQLLDESAFTISEIGYKVGFNDPKYFSKCFFKAYSILPSQYQAKIKNQKLEVES